MSAAPRCYLVPDAWADGVWELTPDESHHVHQVLRLGVGDGVTVLDGRGRRVEARIVSATRKAVCVEPVGAPARVAPPAPRVTLYASVLKGPRMEWLVEKVTELGVSTLVPIITEHTVVRPGASQGVRQQERWHKTALSACKQCGSPWLPVIERPRELASVLGDMGRHDRVLAAILQDSPEPLAAVVRRVVTDDRDVGMVIGPEGDFTVAERAGLADAGAVPVSLGPRVLRAETAAVTALSVVMLG